LELKGEKYTENVLKGMLLESIERIH